MIRRCIAGLLALALVACATVPSAPAHPEARPYAAEADAAADVEAALARAAASGKRVLLVMGGNWCHDSRALAGWLDTPRFAALIAERYEVVYVDVGIPQTGEGRNLDIARRFGLEDFRGTPALLVLTPEGRALNLDTAASWRNAASRSADAIYGELAALGGQPEPGMADVSVWIASDKGECRFALSQEGPWSSDLPDLDSADGGAKIHVRAAEGTAWKCVASGMYQLQQRGLSVGFVSNPAS